MRHSSTNSWIKPTLRGSLSIAAVVFLTSTIAQAINIDGNVRGFAEGYTHAFDVTIDVENGPTGVAGAQLFLFENAEAISVGLILPRTFNDNTYGANKASDWGDKDHFLMGGGNGLEGSDKWEIIVATLPDSGAGGSSPNNFSGDGDGGDAKKSGGSQSDKDSKKSMSKAKPSCGFELKFDDDDDKKKSSKSGKYDDEPKKPKSDKYSKDSKSDKDPKKPKSDKYDDEKKSKGDKKSKYDDEPKKPKSDKYDDEKKSKGDKKSKYDDEPKKPKSDKYSDEKKSKDDKKSKYDDEPKKSKIDKYSDEKKSKDDKKGKYDDEPKKPKSDKYSDEKKSKDDKYSKSGDGGKKEKDDKVAKADKKPKDEKKDDKKSKGGGGAFELKLDYIHSFNEDLPEFDTRIESFKVNGQDVDEDQIDFETSLSYNFEELDLTQYFDTDKNNPIASPGPLPAPQTEGGQVVYDFESPAEEWLADIMFEFELKKSAFDSSGFSLTTETFVENFFTNSIFHMSPNKLGGHKGFVNTIIPMVTPPTQQQPVPPQLPVQGGPPNASGDIPEPASLMLIAGGVAALCMNRRRRRLAA